MTFVVDGDNVRVVNSAIYALQAIQKQMKGAASSVGFLSEEDVDEYITQMRRARKTV